VSLDVDEVIDSIEIKQKKKMACATLTRWRKNIEILWHENL